MSRKNIAEFDYFQMLLGAIFIYYKIENFFYKVTFMGLLVMVEDLASKN